MPFCVDSCQISMENDDANWLFWAYERHPKKFQKVSASLKNSKNRMADFQRFVPLQILLKVAKFLKSSNGKTRNSIDCKIFGTHCKKVNNLLN